MRLLVTGARGQVGWELTRSLQPLGEVLAFDRNGADLSDPEGLRKLVRSVRPDVIVNAAAYVAADRAEDDEALAHCINAQAPGVLAQEAAAIDALLIHYSSDYVFDGSLDRPYRESDAPAPLNAYGRTKLAGERAVAAAGGRWLVFRTSWVYAERGGNFPRTMLQLAREREALKVVTDQIGAPTSAQLIADITAHAVVCCTQERAAGRVESGVYHLAAAGSTSWHGLASRVIDGARRRGWPLRVRRVEGIPAADYPSRARRPANSRLATDALRTRFGVTPPSWEQGIERLLDAWTEAPPPPS